MLRLLTAVKISSGRGALICLALSMLLSSLGTSIANVGLPTLTLAFDASFQAIQWVVLAYLLAITTLIVSAGRLGDMIGRRRLLLWGLALFTVATALCAVATSLWWLIGARAIQGAGAAVMMSLTMAFIGDIVPKEQTGRAMGLLATMSAVGTALGPSLGGMLIAGPGWRAMFYVSVPLGVLTFLLARKTLPDDGHEGTKQAAGFDFYGTLVLVLSMTAYALSMTLGHGQYGVLNGVLLLIAATGIVFFVYVERRVATPLVRFHLFRDPVISTGVVTTALVSTIMMTTLVVGPFYLSRVFGLSAVSVGLVLAVGPLVAALSGVPAGRLVDRFEAKRMTVVSLLMIVIAAFLLAVLSGVLTTSGYILIVGMMTAGYALFQTANNTGVMASVARDQRGVVSGVLNLSRNLGLITGAAVMGAVFAFATAANDINTTAPDVVARAMGVTFAIAGVLVVVALIMAIRIVRVTAHGVSHTAEN